MLGKGMIKLIGYAVTGAIALIAGAELLASVVSIVLAFRLGNISPLLVVIVVTVVLLLLVNRVSEDSPTRLILNILGYASISYLVVVAFVIVLPYGLIFAGIAAGTTAGICSFIKDPGSLNIQFTQFISQMQNAGSLNGIRQRVIPVGDGESFKLNSSHNILLLEKDSREKIIQMMRDRPLLPVSLTCYVDCDVLFISAKFDQVIDLINNLGIETKGHTSPLLAEAIQMIPIIDSQNGLEMETYRLARDEKSITELLSLAPTRMTVFPTISGLVVLVPDMDAPGLLVEQLEQGTEADVLLHRNYSLLEEVEKPVETAA
ncbi:MAG: hypothetical protein KAR03_03415 [Candidatus Thorarchaeota archaeon]|nr:hypothetical protein [Candidatus Thorarchaeota archaeon]